MDEDAIARAKARLAAAAEGREQPAATDAVLERAREGLESLAERASELEATLPGRVADAVRDGMRAEAQPVARQLAEVRGLVAQSIRRLERLEGTLNAERHARLDDLSLLVDLIRSGWKGVDERLGRLEATFRSGEEAVVYRIGQRSG